MGLVPIEAEQLISGVASRLVYEGSICDSWPCWNEGTCIPAGTRNFTCHCTNMFTGRHCEEKISDLCSRFHCSPGICSIRGVSVLCPEEVVDFVSSCLTTPCINGGSCSETVAGHRCLCPDLFHGPFCQFDSDSLNSSWTILELILFLLVVFLVVCAVSLICCSYTNSMGVYVSVPSKRYSRWEEEMLSDDEEDDVIALGELKRNSLRISRTTETMLDTEPGCSNPCLDGAVML